MLILLCVIFIICCISCAIWYHKSDDYEPLVPGMLSWLSGIIALVLFGFAIAGIVVISTVNLKENKIELYQQENQVLEEKIMISVELYLEHENKVYDLDKLNADTLLIALPELNSYDTVVSYIATIKENTNEIKRLKAEVIDVGVWRFLVYFGG